MAPKTLLELEHDTIFFDQGSAQITSAAEVDKLNGAAKFLNLLGFDLSAVVKGHASAEGKPADNQSLSEDRARAVRDMLLAQGVYGVVITTLGVGTSEPAVPENAKNAQDLENQRQQNRRVEIIITSTPVMLQQQPQLSNVNIWKPIQDLPQQGPMDLYRDQLPARLRKPPELKTKEFKEYKKDLDDWLKDHHIDPSGLLSGVLGTFKNYQDAPDDNSPGGGSSDDD